MGGQRRGLVDLFFLVVNQASRPRLGEDLLDVLLDPRHARSDGAWCISQVHDLEHHLVAGERPGLFLVPAPIRALPSAKTELRSRAVEV